MKIFLTHTFQTNLDKKYYELIKEVIKLICDNNHKLYLGGLHTNLKDFLPQYSEFITCYSVEEYKEEIKNCPNCEYKLVEDSFIRTKILCDETDCVLLTPGGTGTLAEFYSILEEYRLEKANKKIYILNIDSYYDNLINTLKSLVDNNFNNEDTLKYIEVININQLKEILKEGI